MLFDLCSISCCLFFFNLISTWYEVELQKKYIWQSRSGSNSNFGVFLSPDLVENFDEASKNEANWTNCHFPNKVKTWKSYMELLFSILTALVWLHFLMISRSIIFGNSFNLQLLLVIACTQYYFCDLVEQTYALK